MLKSNANGQVIAQEAEGFENENVQKAFSLISALFHVASEVQRPRILNGSTKVKTSNYQLLNEQMVNKVYPYLRGGNQKTSLT